MPQEQVELTEKEEEALQRLSEKHGLSPEDVIETLVAAALAQEGGLE
jgi:prolyl-tRNA editing enzyme YbaK/EbsC (Cys-tRNA(Pro) deacylase)